MKWFWRVGDSFFLLKFFFGFIVVKNWKLGLVMISELLIFFLVSNSVLEGLSIELRCLRMELLVSEILLRRKNWLFFMVLMRVLLDYLNKVLFCILLVVILVLILVGIDWEFFGLSVLYCLRSLLMVVWGFKLMFVNVVCKFCFKVLMIVLWLCKGCCDLMRFLVFVFWWVLMMCSCFESVFVSSW